MRKNRAQVSIEFLVLFAAFLAFLVAWMPVINSVRAKAENGIDYALARMAASDLAYAIDDVCFSGPGNVRMVEVRMRGPEKIIGGNGVVKVVANGRMLAERKARCAPTFELAFGGSGAVSVRNEGGGVQVGLAA